MKSRAHKLSSTEIAKFRRIVWAHYRTGGRHALPWRQTRDPYRILVSEVMLQQTQVDRVVGFYERFLILFPTVRDLAQAPLASVLRTWQGLGYNRRAKLLQQAAKDVVEKHKARFPTRLEDIELLPGVGPYTARAVAAFAFNQDVPVIETNIRTTIIHHFFPRKKKVSDAEIEQVLLRVLSKGKSREWYSALMDYGSYLKRSGVSHNARSRHYLKQSKFKGSAREVRGAVLRLLAKGPATKRMVEGLFDASRKEQLYASVEALHKEGFIQKKDGVYMLVG